MSALYLSNGWAPRQLSINMLDIKTGLRTALKPTSVPDAIDVSPSAVDNYADKSSGLGVDRGLKNAMVHNVAWPRPARLAPSTLVFRRGDCLQEELSVLFVRVYRKESAKGDWGAKINENCGLPDFCGGEPTAMPWGQILDICQINH